VLGTWKYLYSDERATRQFTLRNLMTPFPFVGDTRKELNVVPSTRHGVRLTDQSEKREATPIALGEAPGVTDGV